MRTGIPDRLQRGLVLPACPLALTRNRKLDERRQRALLRYYSAAGAGGFAVGVHTTQFAIRQPEHGLFQPLLELAAEEMDRLERRRTPLLRIGGICGQTPQALREAALLHDLRYDLGLLSLGALGEATFPQLLEHCRRVAEVLPIMGFYLQPAVGGRPLPYEFWRRLAEVQNVVAVKIAPFNRYQTLEVMRAIVDAGRDDIALYTGNDDHIVLDLLTPFRFRRGDRWVQRRMVGGLLGHWAVWTRSAVRLLEQCHAAVKAESIPASIFKLANEVTDCNAAIFDAGNDFAGCIAGIHEVLRRQGLFVGRWCLEPRERLSPGQKEEIARVYRAYPHLNDDAFVARHLDEWMSG